MQVIEADGDRVPWARGWQVSAPPAGTPEAFFQEARDFWWTREQPVSGKLPVPYHRIPPPVRSFLARQLGRFKRGQLETVMPQWPLDLSADYWYDYLHQRRLRIEDPEGRTYVLLSHDLDSREGTEQFLEFFDPLEREMGARSANYVVVGKADFSLELAREIRDRGHEVGIHGFDHSNTTPFLPQEAILERLKTALEPVAELEPRGYRAPSLLRTPALLEGLKVYFEYDSSMPSSGGLFPQSNQGCFSARPFRLDSLWELPVSLPRDGSLRFLGYDPETILEIWKHCAEQIQAGGGVVSLLTHCETMFSGNPEMLSAYRGFLEAMAGDSRFVFGTTETVIAAAERQPLPAYPLM